MKRIVHSLHKISEIGVQGNENFSLLRQIKFTNFTLFLSLFGILASIIISVAKLAWRDLLILIPWLAFIAILLFLNKKHQHHISKSLLQLIWTAYGYLNFLFVSRYLTYDYFIIVGFMLSIIMFDRVKMQLAWFVGNSLIIILFNDKLLGIDPLALTDIFVRLAVFFIISLFLKSVILNNEEKLTYERQKAVESRDTIARQAERIARQEQLKKRFYANMGHEIATPLSTINASIEKLQTEPKSFLALGSKGLQNLQQSANRLNQLNKGLQELIAIESGQVKIIFSKVFANDFFAHAVALNIPMAKAKNIELTFNTALNDTQFMHIDSQKMDTVIGNLLTNAIKYSLENGEINLNLQNKDERSIYLTVTDNGIGISPEDIGHIFERFYRASGLLAQENDKTQGLSIGLSVAKEFIELHGGKIEAFSELGKGTRFEIVLPLNLNKPLDDEGPMAGTSTQNKISASTFIKNNILTSGEIDSHALKMLNEHILNNLTNGKLNTDGLAEKLATSRRSLFRLIKKLTGATPAEYIRNIRLAYAYELIQKGEVKTVREAALAIGYKNSNDFCKQFAQLFGEHPAELMAKTA